MAKDRASSLLGQMPAGCFDHSQSSRGVGSARQRKGVANSQVTIGRQKRKITKNVVGEIKQLNESGEGTVVFASLNQPDKDNDILMPGTNGEQVTPFMAAHD